MTPEFKKQIESVLEKAENDGIFDEIHKKCFDEIMSSLSENERIFFERISDESRKQMFPVLLERLGVSYSTVELVKAHFAAHPDFIQKLCKIALASDGLVEAIAASNDTMMLVNQTALDKQRDLQRDINWNRIDENKLAVKKFRDEVGGL